jgi:hypothetical protein
MDEDYDPYSPDPLTHEYQAKFGVERIPGTTSRKPVDSPTRSQKLNRVRQICTWYAMDGYCRGTAAQKMRACWGMRAEERIAYLRAADARLRAILKRSKAQVICEIWNELSYVQHTTLQSKVKLDCIDRKVALLRLHQVDTEKLADAELGGTNHDEIRRHVAQLSYREIEAEEAKVRQLVQARNGKPNGSGNSSRSA